MEKTTTYNINSSDFPGFLDLMNNSGLHVSGFIGMNYCSVDNGKDVKSSDYIEFGRINLSVSKGKGSFGELITKDTKLIEIIDSHFFGLKPKTL